MAISKSKPSLQYPTNIASGDNDYLRVTVFSYEPPGLSAGGEGTIFQIGGTESTREKGNGQQADYLGQIILPMPDNVSDNNAVTWDSDSLNSLALAGVDAAEKLINNLSLTGGSLGKAAEGVADSLTGAANAVQDPEIAGILKKALVGEALNVFGANIDAQSLVSRATGQVLNPNLELLFKGVILRQFNYSFTLTPRSQQEGQEVLRIINTFKRRMAAKSTASNGAGAGLFIKAPDVFQLKFMKGDLEHPFLYKIKQCALTNMNVTYDGAGAYATYGDGTPVKMTLQLSFRELSPVYTEDYDEAGAGVGF